MADFDSATLAGTAAPSPATGQRHAGRTALEIRPTFCPTEVDSPFDTTEWELRTAAIKGEDGKVLFEQPACEIPAAWSQLATNVVVSKYFYGEIHTPEREHSVKQLVHRVARTIADWGIADGYFKTTAGRRELLPRPGLALRPPARRLQLAGLVQRRPVSPVRREGSALQLAVGRGQAGRGACPTTPTSIPQGVGLLHPERPGQHGRHHGPRPQRGDAVQVRLGHRHRPVHAPQPAGEARRRRQALRARSPSCGSTTRWRPW